MRLAPRERLIVALDLSSVEAADAMVKRLGDAVTFYKIGYQLAYAGGLPYARTLADAGKQVFLDLKLHAPNSFVLERRLSHKNLGCLEFLSIFLNLYINPSLARLTPPDKTAGCLTLIGQLPASRTISMFRLCQYKRLGILPSLLPVQFPERSSRLVSERVPSSGFV